MGPDRFDPGEMGVNVQGLTVPDDLSQLSDAELRKLERAIARKHSGMFPWLAVVWAFGTWQFGCRCGLWSFLGSCRFGPLFRLR